MSLNKEIRFNVVSRISNRYPLMPIQIKMCFQLFTKMGNFITFVKKNGESNCQKYITGILERA